MEKIPTFKYSKNEQATSKEFISNQVVCIICLSDFIEEEDLRQLACGHRFHKICIDEWLLDDSSGQGGHRTCIK